MSRFSARAVVLRNAHRTGLQTLERIDLDMKRRERAELPAHRKSHIAIGMYVYEDAMHRQAHAALQRTRLLKAGAIEPSDGYPYFGVSGDRGISLACI
jgi:hypothetical protein